MSFATPRDEPANNRRSRFMGDTPPQPSSTSLKKAKSKARWCQECKDFHPAKDGDGWIEQPSHPLFFGMLLKGMRCPVNSHKPSFDVNTSVTMKNSSNGKRSSSSGQRGGMPNMEETMTEEEIVQWLQNAVQAGAFIDFDGSTSRRADGVWMPLLRTLLPKDAFHFKNLQTRRHWKKRRNGVFGSGFRPEQDKRGM